MRPKPEAFGSSADRSSAPFETYWYLRLVEGTPHIFELNRRLFPKQSELLSTLGLDHTAVKDFVVDEGLDALWERLRTDDEFVRDLKLEALRETLTLAYPSYILALAMGAGKTILIGAIMATEFAMALEYPDGPFVQNTLVFAAGKTIIESLRELAQIPYEKVLPPRFHKAFAASVKLIFTRDGEKNVPVVGSCSESSIFLHSSSRRSCAPSYETPGRSVTPSIWNGRPPRSPRACAS